MESFVDWLNDELNRRGWSRSEAARRGHISASMMDKVINEIANPGLDFCNAIARAFCIPPEDVLRRAGLLPPAPPESASLNEALFLFRQLHPDTQDQVLAMLRGLVEHYVAKKEGPPPRPQ